MYPPIVSAVGQAMLDDLHKQAQRDALARAARRARKAHKHERRDGTAGIRAVIARRAHPRTAPGCP